MVIKLLIFQKVMNNMKLCIFLAFLIRITGGIGGERGVSKVAETQNMLGLVDIWQNKSIYLMQEEHLLLARGEYMPTLK